MRTWILLIVPLAIAASIAAGACGGGGKKTITVGDTKIQTGNKVPADFPSDFPVYKGADFKGSVSSTQQGLTGLAATWESDDSFDSVKAYYADQLGGSSAWTKDSATDTGDGAFYLFHKKSDPTKTGALTIAKANNRTSFVVFVGTNPDAASGSSSSSSSSSTAAAADATANADAATSPANAALPDEAKLNDDFPKDLVPFPSGARVTSTTSLSSGGTKNAFVELYVKDTPSNVSTYFKTELPKRGWTSSVASESNGSFYLAYSGAQGSVNDAVAISIEQSDTPGYAKVGISVTTAGP